MAMPAFAAAASPRAARRAHTHTRLMARFSGTTRYQKGKTNLDFTEARDSEWQWHQLDHMQVCTSLQTDNHASTPPLSFLQANRSISRDNRALSSKPAARCCSGR